MNLKKIIYNFLIWSERYTKTDMIYLAKGGFWLTLGRIVFSISGFLLTIAFANLLSKETYGTYQYVLSVASILAIPTLSGMDTAMVRAIAQGYEGSLIPALKTQIRWGVLGGIASLGVAGYYFLNNNTLAVSFLIIAVFVPLMNPFSVYQSFWNGKKRFDIQAKYNIIIRVLAVSALIITVLLTKNLIFIFGVYFASYTFLYFIFLKITIRKISPAGKQDPQAISYGKHLSLINIIGAIASQLDKILLWHFLGAEALAIYFFAITPVQQIKNAFKGLHPLALPKFSQNYKKNPKAILLKKIGKFLPIMIFVVIIYIISIPYIYKIFLPQYLGSIPYSRLFAITLLFTPQILFITFLTAQKKTKELYIYQFSVCVTQIVLLLVLLPMYGIWGAIIALVATQVLNLGLYVYLFKKI